MLCRWENKHCLQVIKITKHKDLLKLTRLMIRKNTMFYSKKEYIFLEEANGLYRINEVFFLFHIVLSIGQCEYQ